MSNLNFNAVRKDKSKVIFSYNPIEGKLNVGLFSSLGAYISGRTSEGRLTFRRAMSTFRQIPDHGRLELQNSRKLRQAVTTYLRQFESGEDYDYERGFAFLRRLGRLVTVSKNMQYEPKNQHCVNGRISASTRTIAAHMWELPLLKLLGYKITR